MGELSLEEIVAEALYASMRGLASVRSFLEETMAPGTRLRNAALALALAVARNYKFLEHAVALATGTRPRSMLALVLAYEAMFRKHVPLSRLSDIASRRNLPLHARHLSRLRAMRPGEVLEGLRGLRRLSIRYSQPLWVVRYLSRLLGFRDLRLLLGAYNRPHPVWARSRQHREDVIRELSRRGVVAEADPAIPDGLRILEGRVPRRALVFQDRLSMLASHVLAPHAGRRVLDACSSPGIKAAHLYDLVGGRVVVVGADISWRRLASEQALLGRMNIRVDLVQMDSGVPGLRRGFDSVMLDPDCSSMGRLGHSPETRLWLERMGQGVVARMSLLQRRLLYSSLGLVRRGGYVLYTTCTLTLEENENVVREAVEKGYVEPAEPPLRLGFPGVGMPEAQRLYTHIHGSIGGFVVLLRVTGR